MKMKRRTVHTVGHSNRSVDDFLELLREHEVRRLVDVRRFPGSRRLPHFASDALAALLRAARIDYTHEPDLGGYRKTAGDSVNTAWRAPGFRAYADYMASPAFCSAFGRLAQLADTPGTVIMCAEAVFWRCHRQLISDALVALDIEVLHILAASEVKKHVLNDAAKILEDGRLIYTAPPPDQLGLF